MLNEDKKNQIREFLIGLAKKKATTGYLKLNEKLRLGIDFSDEKQMEDLYGALEEVSAGSYRDYKVFLGILTVNKMRNRPSSRFYSGVEKITGSKVEDTDTFFEVERSRLFDHFAP